MSSPDFKITQLSSNDLNFLKELILLFIDVFEEKQIAIPSNDYLEELLKKKNFVVFIATINDQVIGGLTAYELTKYYSENPELFIYDIAIKQEYQRRGVGKMLLESTKKYCLEKGITEIFVAANKEDKHAIDFYNSTGGVAEQAVHFNYSINKNK